MKNRECRECGTGFEPGSRSSLFCSNPCKQRFHNRRRERGAEVYDLLMANGVRDDIVPRLLAAYHVADKALRGGRASYQDTEAAMTRIPYAYGKQGDKR